MNSKYLIFDMETTGLQRSSSNQILEFAALVLDEEFRIIDTIETLIRPEGGVVGASHIHGIYEEHVRRAPHFAELADSIARLFRGNVILGYNIIRFDLPILEANFKRFSKRTSFPTPVAISDIYRLVLKKKWSTENNKLSTIADHYNIPHHAHTAMGDALVVHHLVRRFFQEELRHPKVEPVIYTPIKKDNFLPRQSAGKRNQKKIARTSAAVMGVFIFIILLSRLCNV